MCIYIYILYIYYIYIYITRQRQSEYFKYGVKKLSFICHSYCVMAHFSFFSFFFFSFVLTKSKKIDKA